MVLSVARDITERRLAEKAVREAEEQYRSLFEESPVALWEADASGLIAWLRALRDEGIDDLPSHLAAAPRLLADVARLIEVVRVNHASLPIFAAAGEEELIREWTSCLTDEATRPSPPPSAPSPRARPTSPPAARSSVWTASGASWTCRSACSRAGGGTASAC